MAEKEIIYEKLRLDVLLRLMDDRGIECKPRQTEIISFLKLDDAGKYVRETTYVKDGTGYIVGVDIKNRDHLLQVSKMIEKKEAKNLNRYCNFRVEYWVKQKLI